MPYPFPQKKEFYRDPRILGIFFLGFSSGLPFLLTLATLHVWLSEVRTPKTVIGFFVLITIPYTLKFLWAPFIDYLEIPFLTRVFGRRKGWLLASQISLVFSLFFLGATNPHTHIIVTAFAGLMVAFCSATQDIVFEAYRVEVLPLQEMGPGAGASMLGYRLGMWVSGAGALYLASFFSWFVTYAFMAACVSVGLVTTLLSSEPPQPKNSFLPSFGKRRPPLFVKIQDSFKGFLKRENWKIILLYIFAYKVGDTILNVMTAPFLLEIGFTKLEIAHVVKAFGIGAIVLGGFLGSFLLSRKPLRETLVICALLQIFSCLMFALQAHVGHNLSVLFLTIGIENLTCGMGTAAFITYLSNLCHTPFTATHYALLSSLGSLARVCFSALAGWLADHMEWTHFYILTAAGCLPCFLVVFLGNRSFEYHSSVNLSPKMNPA